MAGTSRLRHAGRPLVFVAGCGLEITRPFDAIWADDRSAQWSAEWRYPRRGTKQLSRVQAVVASAAKQQGLRRLPSSQGQVPLRARETGLSRLHSAPDQMHSQSAPQEKGPTKQVRGGPNLPRPVHTSVQFSSVQFSLVQSSSVSRLLELEMKKSSD